MPKEITLICSHCKKFYDFNSAKVICPHEKLAEVKPCLKFPNLHSPVCGHDECRRADVNKVTFLRAS